MLCDPEQERARALSELRRLEAEIGEATRSLKGAQGDEEALRNKAMHLRDDIDHAELARDKALAALDRATAVSLSHHLSKHAVAFSVHDYACGCAPGATAFMSHWHDNLGERSDVPEPSACAVASGGGKCHASK